MKGRLLFIIALLFCIANVHSQDFYISGKVVDGANDNPLQYATIVLSQNDTIDNIGGITDKKGYFKISVPKGVYNVSIEFLAYQSKTINATEVNSNKNIGTIDLSVDIEALNEVALSANKNKTTLELDKKTYNVEKDIVSNGGTSIDVLANAPSVSISSEGIPLIRGNTATIMINGRISARSKIDALKNLPASSIQKIEVITTPSARFSGDTSGGIINIILKKGLDNGFNGAVTGTTSLGKNEIYGASTTLNYRANKLNIYTNTNFYHRAPTAKTTVKNEYLTNGITDSYLNEDRKYNRENIVFETLLGADYYFNDYISLNIEGSYSNFNGDFDNNNLSKYFDANHDLTLKNERNIQTDHKNNIYEIATVYTQYFEREDEIILIKFSHKADLESSYQYLSNRDLFPNYDENPDEDELIFDDLDSYNTKWFLEYDWPMTETVLFEFGHQAELGKIENDYVNKILVNGNFEINPLTSNQFHYTENWFRVFALYNHSYEKFSYRVGLSVEHTNSISNLITTSVKNELSYTDFNPSASFEYTISDTKYLSFAYRKGLRRPGYPRLNPFELRISETTTFVGNKNLLPYYINSFELSLLNINDKKQLVLNPTLYYRNYHDIWQDVTFENGEIINGTPKLITTPINLGNLNFAGIELLSTYTPNDWLSFDSTIDLQYVTQDGVFEYTDSNNDLVTLDYTNSNFGGLAKVNTSFNLKNDLKFQALVEYDFPSEGAYSKREGYVFMNASASKDIFNKQATLSFITSDVFNSNRTKRTRTPSDDAISYVNSQWKEQSFLLSLTWRFNQSKKELDLKFNENDEEINN
ncbi:MAG: TonB-dependent receptor [Flavobacteriaceae bacterium]